MTRKFSVVIPTRERADTLGASMRSVTTQKYDDLEIIISDNFSQDSTRDVVDSFDDPRIKYINTGKRVSMSENWEFALSHVTGDWITIIGDDDALLPNCFTKVNEIAEATGVQAVRSENCSYHWPNRFGSSLERLLVPTSSGYSVRDCREWLMKVLLGEEKYPELPMLYRGGFISMNAIRAATFGDKFYRSSIPDVYSAVMLSNTLDKYVFSHEPLAIGGSSKHSTGSAHWAKDAAKAKKSLEPDEVTPIEKFQSEGNIPFHPSIPMDESGGYPASLLAIFYESCAQASEVLPDVINVDQETQLKAILMSAEDRHRKSVERWAKTFADKNCLDYDAIAAKAVFAAKAHRRRKFIRKLKTIADVQFLSHKHPMKDVYQASVLAGSVISSKSWVPVRVARVLTGRIHRMWLK